jgi:GNAT superfamily N-acetyltransferase
MESAFSIAIRRATPADRDPIGRIDSIADSARRATIARAIDANSCHVAEHEGRLAGYVIVVDTFFDHHFVSLLYVDHELRRRGVASALMAHVEAMCPERKLFTSTNRSNLAMQRLLEGRGYRPSGTIDNIDEGDPELVYCKFLR